VRNRLQAGLSLFFLVLLVKLSVIPFCELLLRTSSNSHSLLLPVRLALHILSFLPAFLWFLGSSLDETAIDKATYLTKFLSFAGSASGKERLPIGVKKQNKKVTIHILMAIGTSRRL
jgi:hypothetical protein